MRMLTGNESLPNVGQVSNLQSLPMPFQFKFANYTARTEDVNVWTFMDSASANDFTIPADDQFDVILTPDRGILPMTGFIVVQYGAGVTSIRAGTDVTLKSESQGTITAGNRFDFPAQNAIIGAVRVKPNEYLISR